MNPSNEPKTAAQTPTNNVKASHLSFEDFKAIRRGDRVRDNFDRVWLCIQDNTIPPYKNFLYIPEKGRPFLDLLCHGQGPYHHDGEAKFLERLPPTQSWIQFESDLRQAKMGDIFKDQYGDEWLCLHVPQQPKERVIFWSVPYKRTEHFLNGVFSDYILVEKQSNLYDK